MFGSTSEFEPVLDHEAIINIEGGPDVASAVSKPVAPDHNKPLTFRTMMRIFLFSPSAASITGRTRDPFHSLAL
jgi:hypothetical protein